MLKLYWNGEVSFSMGKGNMDRETMSDLGKKKRVYRITNRVYRDLVSACIKIKYQAKFGIVFFTATFPFDPSEAIAQKIFKNFMKNLKLNYHVLNYVWVKERQKSGRIHFHFLSEMPFVPISDLQACFNNCIKNVCPDVSITLNSLRLPNNAKFTNLVQDSAQIAKYMGKYFAKSKYVEWELPCYAITKSLYPLSYDIDETFAMQLCRKYDNYQLTDHEFYAKMILKNVTYCDIIRDFSIEE